MTDTAFLLLMILMPLSFDMECVKSRIYRITGRILVTKFQSFKFTSGSPALVTV